MPLQATSGAASYDAFGGGVPVAVNYIEDVFSTWLHTGNGSTQTITNGIDLSTKGGLVWVKRRDSINSNNLTDTARGANYYLLSNATTASTNDTTYAVSAFNTNGFSLPTGNLNASNNTYASWTFRKQPKFFDVVTYTGNGTAGRTVTHSLGSVPGCMIVRPTSAVDDWFVYHRSLLNSQSLFLNLTAAAANTPSAWNSTTPTSTEFTVGTNSATNANGVSYVAYLFAHDAGGFGLTGTDNVISCGSYTGTGAATKEISLGYEPQWVMVKNASSATNWLIVDQMRGMPVGTDASKILNPNLTNAETSNNRINTLSATGFLVQGAAAETNASGATYIYIAIRRGPMKVPTSGTSVFTPVASRSSGTSQATPIFNAGFPVDLLLTGIKAGGGSFAIPRLTVGQLGTASTAAETSASATYNFGGMLGILSASGGDLSNATVCGWNFRRAPSFFDVVCYTGTGSARTINHNLGVAPEMIICKVRISAGSWAVWHSGLTSIGYAIFFSSSAQSSQPGCWNSTLPTSSVFSVGTAGETNQSTETFVSYLFATCAGVSKVGSYTGTATTLQIDCGFTAGARFVLIKRTDSTGDWYVWDTARGIVSGNDPYLLLNSTAAEVTSTDYIDTYSAGFELSSTAPAAINASGGTFIFLAIA